MEGRAWCSTAFSAVPGAPAGAEDVSQVVIQQIPGAIPMSAGCEYTVQPGGICSDGSDSEQVVIQQIPGAIPMSVGREYTVQPGGICSDGSDSEQEEDGDESEESGGATTVWLSHTSVTAGWVYSPPPNALNIIRMCLTAPDLQQVDVTLDPEDAGGSGDRAAALGFAPVPNIKRQALVNYLCTSDLSASSGAGPQPKQRRREGQEEDEEEIWMPVRQGLGAQTAAYFRRVASSVRKCLRPRRAQKTENADKVAPADGSS